MFPFPDEVIISNRQDISILLRNARVIMADRVMPDGNVLIENGRLKIVAGVGTASLPTADSTIECDGLTLFPGFIDIHIHGAVGVDTMTATATDLQQVSEFLATQGVTAWLPTFVPAAPEQYSQAAGAVEELMNQETNSKGARAIGVHYEGPFVNTAQCGALRSEHFKSFSDRSSLDCLKTPKMQGSVKMITLAPEVEGGVPLISELISGGWVVSLGHTRSTVEILDRAFSAGARHMTHFMNAMPQLHHRAPGPVGWGLVRDDVTCDIIADGVHLDPLVLRLLLKIKGANRLSLISDAIAAAGKGDGEYQIWDETISVRNGRTSNSRGSIAGSVITMLDAVRTMLSLGASELEVARMASTNPARVLGLNGDYGAIEEGKRADLAALDGKGNARLTIVDGAVVYDSR